MLRCEIGHDGGVHILHECALVCLCASGLRSGCAHRRACMCWCESMRVWSGFGKRVRSLKRMHVLVWECRVGWKSGRAHCGSTAGAGKALAHEVVTFNFSSRGHSGPTPAGSPSRNATDTASSGLG